ncbi:hypothetical protein ACH5RR_000363 [Cinchona calisaya]|uniref:Uncharacterized protein n=1 Tax=Cinchona calisaya TaxID=153742 RepID=A0ABD3B1G6_9GENT
MSSIPSSLVILLLFIALCSSNARPIGVINKNEEKSSLARVSISSNAKPSISKKLEAAKEDSSHMENRVNEDNEATGAQKLVEKKHEVKDDHKRSKVGADAFQTESLATVSWKLPHRKRGEQQPGFNLDYAPPETHPPVNN